jgi:hypothetical protein
MKEGIVETLLAYRGEIIGVLGIIVAIAIFWVTRRRIGASYFIQTNRLIGPIGPRFRGLEILYDGNKIESFSASKVFLWNRGSEAIRGTDIAPSSPLRISLNPPGVILGHQVLYCSSPHCNLSTKPLSGRDVLISFDFIDPKQGIIFEVWHGGETGALTLGGSIIGGGKVKRGEPHAVIRHLEPFISLLITLTITMMLFALITLLPDFIFKLAVLPTIAFGFLLGTYASRKLERWTYAGFMVEKLSSGYAKQGKVGSPPAGDDQLP